MKKIFKKVFAGAATLTISASLLAGCSGDEGESGKVNLELFSNKTENVQIYKKLISDFEEQNPSINIELNNPPEAETVLKTRLTKNDLPELMAIGGNATYGELARAGVFKDFKDKELLNNIQPAYIDMINRLVGSEKDGVYGIPYATNANAVIYNKDKFKELGVEVPKTWDAFIQVLEKANAAGETPIYFTLKDAWTAMIPWNSIAANAAPKDFAQLKTNKETTFQKEYDDVASKMLTLLEYGHEDNMGVGYGDGNKAFAQGESVIYLQGNWAIPEIKKANPDINLGVFAMPVTNKPNENKLVSGVDVLFSMKEDMDTEKEEAAMKFVQYMMEHENAKTYIDDQKAFSAVKEVFQEDPVMEGIKVNFEKGLITSFPDHYYPAGMQAANLIQKFLIEKNQEQFLNNMDSEWDKVISR